MRNSFQAEGEIQSLYDSLKLTFLMSNLDSTSGDTILESTPPPIPISYALDAILPAPIIPPSAPSEKPARNAKPGTSSDPGGVTGSEQAELSDLPALP